jgi:hypothetical protein
MLGQTAGGRVDRPAREALTPYERREEVSMPVRSNRLPATHSLLLAALAASLLPLAAGCSSSRARHQVTVAGEATVTRPLALDIDNHNGSVEIRVDSTVARPVVMASCPGSTATERQPDFVSADLVAEEGRGVLRVIASSPDRPEPKYVNLRIIVPACDGLRVRNQGGPVRASGVSGAVDVVNDMPGLTGGTQIRFASPMTQPVTIHANHGGIDLRVPEGSTGLLRFKTDQGVIRADTAKAAVRGAVSNGREQSATMNGGANAVTLTTESGEIHFRYGRQ